MRVKENILITDPDCNDTVVHLSLEPLRGKLSTFLPGQYVRIGIPKVNEPAPGFFAIASSPDEPESFEFFVKNAGPLSAYLCGVKPGTILEVEGPMGKGFDLSPFKGNDVYLVGVGTGIAPLRSVWHNIIRHRDDYGKVVIYAGFLTEMHQLLTEELAELARHDIEVSITLEIGHESWDGPIGYVQHALMADAPDGTHAVACLAGMSAMVDACTETLQNLGFNESRILLNH
ncbi:NAD(P)H-flavin reductase [Mariprofundus ferrinatatus]|uniref:NAD(P)H-flavin reductase n=1 Tax=Mariprofundus ferrinatatus TaxID=1921087 RepID=A0A2K8L966_9PROT|nr:FAD-binding oxidoreductase [Mariprofundus ferrinatatus]ATX82799.1 NAD(P)H-flavin reductase [Mariprofundus ferrinatatus]